MSTGDAFARYWKWVLEMREDSGYDEESEHEDIAYDAFKAGQKEKE